MRSKSTGVRTTFWIDVAIFVCFVGVLITGCALIGDHPVTTHVNRLQNVHSAFGVIIAALSLVHLVLHRRWWSSVLCRINHLSQPVRSNLVIDSTLLVSFVLITVTGFFLWSGEKNHFFLALHVMTAFVILINVIRHISRHWKWITTTTRRIFKAQPATKSSARSARKSRSRP